MPAAEDDTGQALKLTGGEEVECERNQNVFCQPHQHPQKSLQHKDALRMRFDQKLAIQVDTVALRGSLSLYLSVCVCVLKSINAM